VTIVPLNLTDMDDMSKPDVCYTSFDIACQNGNFEIAHFIVKKLTGENYLGRIFPSLKGKEENEKEVNAFLAKEKEKEHFGFNSVVALLELLLDQDTRTELKNMLQGLNESKKNTLQITDKTEKGKEEKVEEAIEFKALHLTDLKKVRQREMRISAALNLAFMYEVGRGIGKYIPAAYLLHSKVVSIDSDNYPSSVVFLKKFVHPEIIKKNVDKKRCVRINSHNKCYPIKCFYCKTCVPDENYYNMIFCEPCALTCHKDHEKEDVKGNEKPKMKDHDLKVVVGDVDITCDCQLKCFSTNNGCCFVDQLRTVDKDTSDEENQDN